MGAADLNRERGLPDAPAPARSSTVAERQIREIVFFADLSAASERAFGHARLLAEGLDAHLTVYHAVELPADAASDEGPRREAWHRAEAAARERVSHWTAGLTAPCDVIVEPQPSARQAVVDFVQTRRPDLAVMATHGREGLARFVLGSVTEAALAEGVCPVLCVREPEHGAALPYRRVLVPTDLTELSRLAFPVATAVARAFAAEVIALHVAPTPAVSDSSSLYTVADSVEREVPDEQRLREMLERELPGVQVTARVELGSAWDRIVEVARTERADLIVLTTHGHDSLADRVLGSHAERLVRQAPCPVLVV